MSNDGELRESFMFVALYRTQTIKWHGPNGCSWNDVSVKVIWFIWMDTNFGHSTFKRATHIHLFAIFRSSFRASFFFEVFEYGVFWNGFWVIC